MYVHTIATIFISQPPVPEDLSASGISQWVATVALGLLVGAIAYGLKWVARKSGSELVKAAMGKLEHAVRIAVAEVQQTYVDAIKKQSADGKLTMEEQKKALQLALASAKSLLGWRGIKILVKAFGWDPEALDSFLAPHIEAAVADNKLAAKAVAADPSRPSAGGCATPGHCSREG